MAGVRSLAYVLGQTVDRAYQANCDAALVDARCQVDLEAPALTGCGAVLALVRDRGFAASGFEAFATGWLSSGTVQRTGGANAGRRAAVMMHEFAATDVSIIVMEVPLRVLSLGDILVICNNCDKRLETHSIRGKAVAPDGYRSFEGLKYNCPPHAKDPRFSGGACQTLRWC